MGSLLTSDLPLINETWYQMRVWYNMATNHPPPPAYVALEQITAECMEIYRWLPYTRDIIPVEIDPLPIDYSIPSMYKIEWSVWCLW